MKKSQGLLFSEVRGLGSTPDGQKKEARSVADESIHAPAAPSSRSKPTAPPPSKLKLKGKLREMEKLAGSLRPGDGIDPREEARMHRRALGAARPGRAHGLHKQEQLSCQVSEALDAALFAAGSAELNALSVREVVPHGSTLLVVLGPRLPDQAVDTGLAMEALERATAMLTREVASTITRKDTPVLKFLVLPAGAARVDE